jgi:hypothetical protein
MRVSPAHSEEREIARWSEPLVADDIYNAYEACFGGKSDLTEFLGRHHCRMWRSLLEGEARRAELTRRELVQFAQRAGIGEEVLTAIDMKIFNNLLEIILRRGMGSRDSARSDGMTLVHAASTLGEIRRAA